MSRIKQRFDDLKSKHKTALIPFITAGDPRPDITVKLMHALVEAGADLLELGVPFSDPMAEGPTIQAACERALEHGTSLTDVLDMVEEFRKSDSTTPVLLMGYLNPIEVMGYKKFAQHAGSIGMDGLLTVDMPPEEASGLLSELALANIDPVFLLAPTTTQQRIEMITQQTKGFVYYVSLKGVTGVKSLEIKPVEKKIKEIRQLTDLPIGVGFGIKDAESAASVAQVADAVVVGSAIVSLMAKHKEDEQAILTQVPSFLQELRRAVDI